MSTVLPKLSQLSRNVWRVLGCNASSMTLQGTNVYLVGRGSTRIMIDAGPKNETEYFQNMRKLLKDQNARVDRLILTHWHKDHVGGLEELIPIFKERNGGVLPCVYKFPRLDQPDDPIPKEYPYAEMTHGQIFQYDGVTLEAIYTPGHTTDHAVIHLKEENTIFAGDLMLGEGTGIFEELYDYMGSLTKLLQIKPRRIFCGHGPVIEDAVDRILFYMDHQLMREKKIYNFLNEASPRSLSVTELVGRVYSGLSANLQRQATLNIKHHLRKLQRENKIQQQQGKYFVNKMMAG